MDIVLKEKNDMEKVYLVYFECSVDGYRIFSVTPCGTFEKAKEVIRTERDFILNESVYYSNKNLKDSDAFEFIDEETHFRVFDYNDDYWEDYYIEERQVE